MEFNSSELSKLTLKELKVIAKGRVINFSKMKKQELIDSLVSKDALISKDKNIVNELQKAIRSGKNIEKEEIQKFLKQERKIDDKLLINKLNRFVDVAQGKELTNLTPEAQMVEFLAKERELDDERLFEKLEKFNKLTITDN